MTQVKENILDMKKKARKRSVAYLIKRLVDAIAVDSGCGVQLAVEARRFKQNDTSSFSALTKV